MDDRERVWKIMFKNKPMPEQTDGAVEECFGMLNDVLGDLSEEEFNEILMEVKGKSGYVGTNEEEQKDDV
jgi:hypothetical protein